MNEAVTPEAIKAVLDALVGTTACHGVSAMEDVSMRNVKRLGAVFEWCWERLRDADRHRDSPYYSAERVSRLVFIAAGDLGIAFLDDGKTCPMCYRPYEKEAEG